MDDGRNDVLMELSESVALTMVTKESPPDKISANLGKFSAALPQDAAMALFRKIGKHCQDLSKPKYFTTLSEAMSKNADYKKALVSIHSSKDRVREDINKDKK